MIEEDEEEDIKYVMNLKDGEKEVKKGGSNERQVGKEDSN